MKLDWEIIEQSLEEEEINGLKYCTSRIKTPMGWIVKNSKIVGFENLIYPLETMTFVPDPNHEWTILKR